MILRRWRTLAVIGVVAAVSIACGSKAPPPEVSVAGIWVRKSGDLWLVREFSDGSDESIPPMREYAYPDGSEPVLFRSAAAVLIAHDMAAPGETEASADILNIYYPGGIVYEPIVERTDDKLVVRDIYYGGEVTWEASAFFP